MTEYDQPTDDAANPEPAPAPAKSKAMWSYIAGGCLLLVGAARIIGAFDKSSQIDEANKLIDEARVSVSEAQQQGEEGAKQIDLVFTDSLGDLAAARVKFKPEADKGIDLYGKSAESFRRAEKQFEQAAAMRVDSVLQEYWGLKAKQMSAMAEIQDVLVNQFRLALNESIADEAELVQKIQENAKPVEEIAARGKDFGERAEKVMADHPAAFAKE